MPNRAIQSRSSAFSGYPEGTSSLATKAELPHLVQRLLPDWAMDLLRELRIWVLMREFRHPVDVDQSAPDAQASADMSIVVPIHDAPDVVRRCLVSLERFAPQAEVLLIDDGSKLAETRSLITGFVGRNGWKLIQHEMPRGHSLACEEGAALTTRPYLCLLNSDTVVTPWCWRLVGDAFEQDNNIAVVGPSTSSSGNAQTLPLAKRLRKHWNDSQICDFALRLQAETANLELIDLTWISGFAFFIRRSAWDSSGGFDPNLPDYGNEIDLCGRLAAKGFRMVWVRNAYIHHLGGQSYGKLLGQTGIDERTMSALAYVGDKERALPK